MIWIVGEYGERIDNALDLMLNFTENFKDEAKKVQLAILNAAVKLYLKLEAAAEDLVQEVLKLATDESDNPDLRNRGYIYWRMLSSNPEMAKRIILCQKPTISEDSATIETQLLDRLVDNIGMLSSVYYKPPESFVKKIREKINERFDLENDDAAGGSAAVEAVGEDQRKNKEEYIDSQGVSRSQYLAEQNNNNNLYSYSQDLLGVDEPRGNAGAMGTSAIDDLLGLGGGSSQPPSQIVSSTTDLDDLLGGGGLSVPQNGMS